MGFVKFGPNGNEWDVDSFNFPGGEVQVKLLNTSLGYSESVNVDAQIQSSDDVMKLLLTCEALCANGWNCHALHIAYVPYARQDRRCNIGEAHSLKVFCKLINSLKFKQVRVLDPHSDVVEALIDNVMCIPQEKIVERSVPYIREYYLISPDAGALKKIYKVAKTSGAKGVIKADKVRNIQTGKIESVDVNVDSKLLDSNNKFLVVDDICDGGRTFVELAKALASEGIKKEELTLFVTHGIFSNGFDELLQYYNHIYTTNSFRCDINHKDVTVYNIW